MLPKFEKILSITEETIILVMIISSLLFVFLNIVLRYLFSGGFVAAEEYARYTMVLLVYIGMSQAIKNNSMIKVDILSTFLPKLQLPFDLIANIASMVMAIILIWFGMQFTVFQYETGQKSIGMELPLWIAYGFVPLGGVLMLGRYLADTVKVIKKHGEKKSSAILSKGET